jgi:hypothetical protein
MLDRVGAAVRNVDGKVADDPDAALRRISAKRRPLPLEADLVGQRAGAREPFPAGGPVGVTIAEALDLPGLDLGSRVAQEAAPAGERRRGRVRGAVPVRRDEREDLPPPLPRRRQPVDEALCLRSESPARERRGVEKDAGRPVQ